MSVFKTNHKHFTSKSKNYRITGIAKTDECVIIGPTLVLPKCKWQQAYACCHLRFIAKQYYDMLSAPKRTLQHSPYVFPLPQGHISS